MQEALFYKKVKDKVLCQLCPHYCLLEENEKGKCLVRQNINGVLQSLNFGKAIALNIDPIEKKPLFHFLPGSFSMSVATVGCNLDCKFCQNSDISQPNEVKGQKLLPAEVVKLAKENGCASIAYTYTEPTIFFEYVIEIAKLARKEGIKNILVSNGFINSEPLKEFCKYVDAVNIDLKSFSDEFYKEVVDAKLQPVLDAIQMYNELGVFVEVTTLIIPGENDSDEELKKIAEFVASIGKNIPWHVSRFHPMYKMKNKDITSEERLIKAVEIGKKVGLKYVYVGNIRGNEFENTYCPKCKEVVIQRNGFNVERINLNNDKCQFCNEKINIEVLKNEN